MRLRTAMAGLFPFIGGTLLSMACFSAGMRVVDISSPYLPKENGDYIPDTTKKTNPA